MSADIKTVLVHLCETVRPARFMGLAANLLSAIWVSFRVMLHGDKEMVVQVKSISFFLFVTLSSEYSKGYPT